MAKCLGNIIWKLFRRMGYLDKMWDIIYTTYNKANSLKESKINEDYYKNSMTDSTTWFDGEPTEPAKYGGKWIHVEPLKGWERIGVIDDSRNKNKILYVFGNPNAEQTENFQQFKERNLSLNKDENGKDGYNHFYIDTRYCKVVLYPQYENSYYDVAINDGNNKQYKLKKHQELMSKLFLVNVSGQNKIILQHDSSYCITDGVVKKGKTNPWSNNSDFGCYFWASRNIGADPSNGQQYTYFCVVDADKCYDTEYNPDNYKTDKEVYDKYDYWFKELNGGVACQTASQTPIWCVRDNKTGQFYDKEWNVIQKPPTLN